MEVSAWMITTGFDELHEVPYAYAATVLDGWQVRVYAEPEPECDPDDDEDDGGYWRYEAERNGVRQGGHGYGARTVEEALEWTREALEAGR